jgi:hypothetical protein
MAKASTGNGNGKSAAEFTPPGVSSPRGIVLPPLALQTIEVTLVGDSSMIMHRWSAKHKKMMLDKQTKRAKGAKEAKDPQRDFEESAYAFDADGTQLEQWSKHKGPVRFAFPTTAFKSAAVTACTSIGGITKVQARQAFRVLGEFSYIEGAQPKLREDMVRIGMGVADIRYRAEFWPWWTTLTIQHNENVMSAEQILNMLNTAGFGVGVGEWRPERDGDRGTFHVANEADMKMIEEFNKKKNKN